MVFVCHVVMNLLDSLKTCAAVVTLWQLSSQLPGKQDKLLADETQLSLSISLESGTCLLLHNLQEMRGASAGTTKSCPDTERN